VQHC
jgi:hypothetical protein